MVDVWGGAVVVVKTVGAACDVASISGLALLTAVDVDVCAVGAFEIDDVSTRAVVEDTTGTHPWHSAGHTLLKSTPGMISVAAQNSTPTRWQNSASFSPVHLLALAVALDDSVRSYVTVG